LSRDAAGEPVATYGFESDAAAFVGPLFDRITEREALLPPSLISGLPADSVLAITVTDPQGRPVYRSRASFPGAFVGIDTIERGSGGLVVQVALMPQVADRLVVGGLPRSQLPLLVGLFLLTCGLVAVALHQIRRQQELARLRTDFVSGVSHELRTPLAQIRLFAELLHTGTLRSEEEREHSARVVDQEARRLTYLVENVLSFSRADRRANRVSPEPTDIEEELSGALEMFEPVAAARGVELRAELAPGVVAPVDRGALRQVVLNLLDNAVKYGPEGQTVAVGSAMAPNGLRIWVEDEGKGVPAEERDRIFEPYHRLERDANSAVGGSGIGLAVVRELVELHGGRVWVEEATGGGARFVLELPATRDESADATPVTGGVA
jgi:signal transduction histidine kinase